MKGLCPGPLDDGAKRLNTRIIGAGPQAVKLNAGLTFPPRDPPGQGVLPAGRPGTALFFAFPKNVFSPELDPLIGV